MKLGLIARCDDRGLGHMTWDFYRHLTPDRTLVVDMGVQGRGFHQHVDRYPGATVVPYLGGLPEREVRSFLDGIDVLYSAETFYDPRLVSWARDAGCRTVLHVMPEFYRPDEDQPDAIWLPTSWRRELLPRADVVAVPVAEPTFHVAPSDGQLRVVHVAGNRAAGDRNGTILVANALRYVQRPMTVRIETQGHRLPSQNVPSHVSYRRHVAGRRDRWTLYSDADVLLMPRRYGGLCLPAQEALAVGVIPVMPEVSPNLEWPVVPLDAGYRGTIETPGGAVPLANVDPHIIAEALDLLAVADLDEYRERARVWAADHSWRALAPMYRSRLDAVAAPAAA